MTQLGNVGLFPTWLKWCLIITFIFLTWLISIRWLACVIFALSWLVHPNCDDRVPALAISLSANFAVRTGTLPIRITDYRYKLLFLHGSTCWLGNKLVPNIQLEKLSSPTRLKMLKCGAIGGNMNVVFLLLVRRVFARWTWAKRLQVFEVFLNQWHELRSSPKMETSEFYSSIYLQFANWRY